MAIPVFAAPTGFSGRTVPSALAVAARRSIFGDLMLCLFLLAQCFDGVFTYVGVVSYGVSIEGNPLIAGLMAHLGHGMALFAAKSVAGLLGIALHIRGIHVAVAALAVFYLAVAVFPWLTILFG